MKNTLWFANYKWESGFNHSALTVAVYSSISSFISGVEIDAKEENLALYTVAGNLPIPMDNLYINAYCSKEQKDEIIQIVDEFKAYYRDMLEKDVN